MRIFFVQNAFAEMHFAAFHLRRAQSFSHIIKRILIDQRPNQSFVIQRIADFCLGDMAEVFYQLSKETIIHITVHNHAPCGGATLPSRTNRAK